MTSMNLISQLILYNHMKNELCFRKQSIQLFKHQPSEVHIFNYDRLILLSIYLIFDQLD